VEAFLYQSGPACRIYILADGSNCPAEDFLDTSADLQPDEFAKLTKLLDHTCDHGIPKNKQKVNTLGDGLFEFKTIGGLRLIWFWDANRIILCTHGFLKKRQTTPPAELVTAAKWKKAYESARKANQLKFIEDHA
jgi:phage-related protein